MHEKLNEITRSIGIKSVGPQRVAGTNKVVWKKASKESLIGFA